MYLIAILLRSLVPRALQGLPTQKDSSCKAKIPHAQLSTCSKIQLDVDNRLRVEVVHVVFDIFTACLTGLRYGA